MKKINLFIYLMIATFLLSSCDDALDSENYSSFPDEVVFSTEELANEAVLGIVVSMGETNSYRARFLPYYGSNTDVEYFNNSEKIDNKSALATYSVAANNTEMNTENNAWAKIYEGIERANLAIVGFEKVGKAEPGTALGQLLAEALTLRAVLYLDLTRAWGDVPARFTPIDPLDATTLFIPKSDRDTIYIRMIADLKKAQDYAFWPGEHEYTKKVGRVNKTFIKALRAKYCLVAGGYAQRPDGSRRLSNDPALDRKKMYQEAEKELTELLTNEQSGSLDNSFEGIFKKLCEEVKTAGGESLWEIPFSENRGRMTYTFGVKHQAADQYGPEYGGTVGPTANLWYDYSEKDLRREVTCVPYKWSNSKTAVQVISELKTWYFGKYRYEWMSGRKVGASVTDDGLKKQYMRYAEIYLMMAEVKNELHGYAEAAPYLKDLRTRAFAAADRPEMVETYVNNLNSNAKMFDAIVNEHAFEFAGEMVRKEALIRWNLLGTKMAETKVKLTNLSKLEGEYADVPAKVYYRNVAIDASDKLDQKIEFYGLNRGETANVSAEYSGSTEWVSTSKLKEEKIQSLFVNDPDKFQFWPIWQVFIDGSRGTLTNDYGY